MDYNFRTLNYLGSKLRLLDFIEDKVRCVTEEGEGVCDLFAGSGSVSYRLSKHFAVTSCDIQCYSKTICNALLNRFDVSVKDIDRFMSDLRHDDVLFACFEPLILIEEQAINTKNTTVLSEVVENGSVEVYRLEARPSSLNTQLNDVLTNLDNKALLNERSLISRYYGGVYFSYRQAVWIDIILETIHRNVSEGNRDLYLAALLSTASDIADTVGKHFAQPIKTRDPNGNIKNTVYNKALKDKTVDVVKLYGDWLVRYAAAPKTRYSHYTVQHDYLECLRNLPPYVKTVYADPPYTRDHYSRYYHVLETITLRDSPELSTTNIHGEKHISNGIYRSDRHQSPFCIKSKAPEAFKAMFEIISGSDRNLLLSYSPYDESKKSHPRVVTMHELIIWAQSYFDNVEVVSAGTFKHSKLNSTDHFLEASDEAEVLIVCTNE